MSETRARASRFAFWFGSLARKGLIGARLAGVAPAPAPPGGEPVPAGAAAPGLAPRVAKCGRSSPAVLAGAIGVAFETVGRIGDGSPPRAGPVDGPGRVPGTPAGGALVEPGEPPATGAAARGGMA